MLSCMCTANFDLVYYAYSHTARLDFSSLVQPTKQYIDLPDEVVLKIL